MFDLQFLPENFSFGFSNVDATSLIIALIILYIAKSIVLMLHEVGHWVVGGFKGKIVLKWFPYPHGAVEWENKLSSDDPFIKKFHDFLIFEAGCAVNMGFAIIILLLFPSLDLNNWFHVFIFSLGFSGLLSTAYNVGLGHDHTSVFHIFGVHNFIVRLIFGLILALTLLYIFKDYYIVQFFQIISNIQNPQFYASFSF